MVSHRRTLTSVVTGNLIRAMATFVIAVLVTTLTACTPGPTDPTSTASSTSTDAGPITVVSTTDQWGSIAKSIGTESVDVTSIMDSTDIDATHFAPTSKDITAIRQADVIVINGAGYDDWATDSIRQGATVVSAAQAVGALKGDNPYLWFSKDARSSMAKELAETFTKAVPKQKTRFNKNLTTWNAAEQRLDDHMGTVSSQLDGARYASTQPVAFYLMADLDVSDVTPKSYANSIANDEQPDDRATKAFTSLIENAGIDLLMNDSQYSDETTTKLVHSAELAGIPVLDVSEQMPDDEDNVTAWIDSLVSAIAKTVSDTSGSGTHQPSIGIPSPSTK